jgi:hypothetical protein
MGKKDINVQGKCLAKWDLVCRPKDQGGLGVLNLGLQNKALLIKNLQNSIIIMIIHGSISFGRPLQ